MGYLALIEPASAHMWHATTIVPFTARHQLHALHHSGRPPAQGGSARIFSRHVAHTIIENSNIRPTKSNVTTSAKAESRNSKGKPSGPRL